MIIKAFLTGILSFTVLICSAQKQLLTFQDLQFIAKNPSSVVKPFLQEKDYYLHPVSNASEMRYLMFFSDTDYIDIAIRPQGRRQIVNIKTTHLKQAELIQNAIQSFSFKDHNGTKTYRIKDGMISTLAYSETEAKPNTDKVYTIEAEN